MFVWIEFFRDIGFMVCNIVDELFGADFVICDAISMEVLVGVWNE